jgi:hypothetical protein
MRSKTPGLKRRKRVGAVALYWSAAALSPKDAKRYPDPLIRLPPGATPAEIEGLCQLYASRFDAWRSLGDKPRFFYDGTIGSLCDAFERHPQSPMREVKFSTAGSYGDALKVIRSTVAARAVRAVAPIDVKGWYARWRAPAKQDGPERVKRAHDAVAMLRQILHFGQALGFRECGELADGLSKVRFERSSPRTTAMTVEHCKAFIASALARGDKRGLYMAIGVACQFETMLRQIDVIGEWVEANGRETWAGAFTWENIPGGILRLRTSKTSTPVAHDLTRLELLWPLLQMVPQSERVGAVVKGEGDLPIRTRSYRKWFAEIRKAAGLPSDLWSMDARAGAVTEALDVGADLTDVSRAATHTTVTMTRRYDRETEEAAVRVAEARKQGRNRGRTG